MMDFVKKNSAIAIFYTIYTSRQSTHAILSIFRINIQALHVYATTAVSVTMGV